MRALPQPAQSIENMRRTPDGGAPATAGPRPAHVRRTEAGKHRSVADRQPDSAPEGQPDSASKALNAWALIRRAQDGDREAFGAIYELYVDTIYRFTSLRTGSQQIAEDLTADTFLRALRGIGNFTWQGRDPVAWLLTIARNLIADHYKSARHRVEGGTGEIRTFERESPGVEGQPESTAVDRVQNEALFGALGRLKPEHRECLVLRFFQGLSVSETARVMGRNDAAVKALQYRAVRALARRLPREFLDSR